MRSVHILLTFLVFPWSSGTLYSHEDDQILELGPGNFSEVVHQDIFAFVLFYMPWCDRCSNVAQEMSAVRRAFHADRDVIVFGKVNIEACTSLARTLRVTGFPTLYWFSRGTGGSDPRVYVGDRNAQSMTSFINHEAGTSVRFAKPTKTSAVVHLSTSTFETVVLNEQTHAMVLFYDPQNGKLELFESEYEAVARELLSLRGDVVVAKIDVTKARSIAQSCGIPLSKRGPFVRWFALGHEKSAIPFDGELTASSLLIFADENVGCGSKACRKDEEPLGASAEGRFDEADRLVDTFVSRYCDGHDDSSPDYDNPSSVDIVIRRLFALDRRREGALYAKIADKIQSRGVAYVASEQQRLKRMLSESHNFSTEKIRLFRIRLGILDYFRKAFSSSCVYQRGVVGN